MRAGCVPSSIYGLSGERTRACVVRANAAAALARVGGVVGGLALGLAVWGLGLKGALRVCVGGVSQPGSAQRAREIGVRRF